jgi:hypothetical protein
MCPGDPALSRFVGRESCGTREKSRRWTVAPGVLSHPLGFPMLTRRFRTLTGLLLLALVAAATGGCDLNPQPLPPGALPSAGEPGGTEDAGTTVATPEPGTDAGPSGISSDASILDGGGLGTPGGDADANGGGLDAADADGGESDAAGDAPSDAPEDAG